MKNILFEIFFFNFFWECVIDWIFLYFSLIFLEKITCYIKHFCKTRCRTTIRWYLGLNVFRFFREKLKILGTYYGKKWEIETTNLMTISNLMTKFRGLYYFFFMIVFRSFFLFLIFERLFLDWKKTFFRKKLFKNVVYLIFCKNFVFLKNCYLKSKIFKKNENSNKLLIYSIFFFFVLFNSINF